MRSVDDLIEEFVTATEQRRLGWSLDAGRYVAVLPRHRLAVWEWTDPADDTGGVTLELQRHDGEVIDYAKASQFSPRYPQLEAVHTAARRSANNVDAEIRALQDELAGLAPRV